MKIKLREFMALRQGSQSIREYVQVFNELARYALNHVDTDAKKRECFLEGMSPKLRSRLGHRLGHHFKQDQDGVIWFKNRLVVPKNLELRKKILDEAHLSRFSIHLGSTKMYQDLKQRFWWTRMKREIAKYSRV